VRIILMLLFAVFSVSATAKPKIYYHYLCGQPIILESYHQGVKYVFMYLGKNRFAGHPSKLEALRYFESRIPYCKKHPGKCTHVPMGDDSLCKPASQPTQKLEPKRLVNT